MKIKVKNLLVIVLIVSFCMVNGMVSAEGETERVDKLDLDCVDGDRDPDDDWVDDLDWNSATEDFCDIKIRYQTTSHSDNRYNVDVTLENWRDERIDNWEIRIPANYEIENIWNATIIDHIDNEYTIHNAEANQDIAVGGSVSFGMTVVCSEQVEMPVYVFTTGLSNRLEETEYKMEFRKQRREGGKFDGKIIITNLQEKKIEDWNMSFECNFKINKIWNAAFADDYFRSGGLNHYVIENPGYNQNIAPKESLEFGFTATCGGEPKISCMEVYEITSDIDFSEDDEEDEEEYEFILDSDYFETREEYEKYLEEHGYTDECLIDLDE